MSFLISFNSYNNKSIAVIIEQNQMIKGKRLDQTFSAQQKSRLLYSQAPSTIYYGGQSTYQPVPIVRPTNFRQGNTDTLPRSAVYMTGYKNPQQAPQQYLPQYLHQSQNQNVYQPPARTVNYSQQRPFLPFRPLLPNEVNYVSQPKLQNDIPLSNDFRVYCPACHQEYYNSQVDQHIQRHYLFNADQFKVGEQNAMDVTNESINNSLAPSRTFYPLIQPQEFQAKELDQVNFKNQFKVDVKKINQKNSGKTFVKDAKTQFGRAPLQYQTKQTDFYNCFDNVFNSKSQFSVDDLIKNNKVIATKRHLQDWQKVRSQKQGYRAGK